MASNGDGHRRPLSQSFDDEARGGAASGNHAGSGNRHAGRHQLRTGTPSSHRHSSEGGGWSHGGEASGRSAAARSWRRSAERPRSKELSRADRSARKRERFAKLRGVSMSSRTLSSGRTLAGEEQQMIRDGPHGRAPRQHRESKLGSRPRSERWSREPTAAEEIRLGDGLAGVPLPAFLATAHRRSVELRNAARAAAGHARSASAGSSPLGAVDESGAASLSRPVSLRGRSSVRIGRGSGSRSRPGLSRQASVMRDMKRFRTIQDVDSAIVEREGLELIRAIGHARRSSMSAIDQEQIKARYSKVHVGEAEAKEIAARTRGSVELESRWTRVRKLVKSGPSKRDLHLLRATPDELTADQIREAEEVVKDAASIELASQVERLEQAARFVDDAVNERPVRLRATTQLATKVYRLYYMGPLRWFVLCVACAHLMFAFWEPTAQDGVEYYSSLHDRNQPPDLQRDGLLRTLLMCEWGIFGVYFLDIALKATAYGPRYFFALPAGPASSTDAVVHYGDTWDLIRVALLVLLCVDLALATHAPPAEPHFRFFRVLRPLWLIAYVKELRRWVYLSVKMMPKLLEMVMLMTLIIGVFGVVGLVLFSGTGLYDEDPLQNFDNIGSAMLSLFVLYTSENYPAVMYPAYITATGKPNASKWFAVYFVAFLLIGMFCLSNLVVPMLYKVFRKQRRKLALRLHVEERRALLVAFHLLDWDQEGSISVDRFHQLVLQMRPEAAEDAVLVRLMVSEMREMAMSTVLGGGGTLLGKDAVASATPDSSTTTKTNPLVSSGVHGRIKRDQSAHMRSTPTSSASPHEARHPSSSKIGTSSGSMRGVGVPPAAPGAATTAGVRSRTRRISMAETAASIIAAKQLARRAHRKPRQNTMTSFAEEPGEEDEESADTGRPRGLSTSRTSAAATEGSARPSVLSVASSLSGTGDEDIRLSIFEFFYVVDVINRRYRRYKPDHFHKTSGRRFLEKNHVAALSALIPLLALVAVALMPWWGDWSRVVALGSLALALVEHCGRIYLVGFARYKRSRRQTYDAIVTIVSIVCWSLTEANVFVEGTVPAKVWLLLVCVRSLKMLAYVESFRDTLLTINTIGRFMCIALSIMTLLMYCFAIIGTEVFAGRVDIVEASSIELGRRLSADPLTPLSSDVIGQASAIDVELAQLYDRVRELESKKDALVGDSGPSTVPLRRTSEVENAVPITELPYYDEFVSFDDFGSAMMALLQMVTTSNWHEEMYTVMLGSGEYSTWTALFFVVFYFLAVTFMLNLVIAIYIDAFETAQVQKAVQAQHRVIKDVLQPAQRKAAQLLGEQDEFWKIKGSRRITTLSAYLAQQRAPAVSIDTGAEFGDDAAGDAETEAPDDIGLAGAAGRTPKAEADALPARSERSFSTFEWADSLASAAPSGSSRALGASPSSSFSDPSPSAGSSRSMLGGLGYSSHSVVPAGSARTLPQGAELELSPAPAGRSAAGVPSWPTRSPPRGRQGARAGSGPHPKSPLAPRHPESSGERSGSRRTLAARLGERATIIDNPAHRRLADD